MRQLTDDDISYGGELRGITCAKCGGDLVIRHGTHADQIWCDWCGRVPVHIKTQREDD